MIIDSNLILMLVLFFVIGGGIITGIVIAVQIAKHRPARIATSADRYIVEGGANMAVIEDSFLRTHTTRVKVSSSSSSGGGSSGRRR